MRFIRPTPLLCALLLAACGTTQQGGYTALGLSWRSQAFEGRGETGHNLIAELPGPAGAHCC